MFGMPSEQPQRQPATPPSHGASQALPPLSRRAFLATSAAATAAGLATLTACSTSDHAHHVRSNGNARDAALGAAPEAATVLPIPPLAEFVERDGRRATTLVAQEGTSEIQPGITTPTWGFNGPHLGPTLKLSRGERVDLTVRNHLPEVTSVHWHGALVPAQADGGPHSPIEPGAQWTASFTVDQPASTLWYHPHPHGVTGLQAYRGLAGMIIIDDEWSDRTGLPSEYGVDDVPVVLTDANFLVDGTLDETLDPDVGLLGNTVSVNGVVRPAFEATTRHVRLRLLDGSTMRFHRVAFADDRPFHHVASDAGLLDAPRRVRHIDLGPGERAEVVVDLEPGEDVWLRSIGFEDRLGVPDDEYAPDFDLQSQFDLLLLRGPQAPATSPRPLSAKFRTGRQVPDSKGLITRRFELNTFEINGKSMDMERVDVVIAHDRPEIWEVTNGNSDWIHNFHIHNSAFRVLSLTGTDVPVEHDGWKDTVTLPPGATARLLVQFGQYRDPHYPYMFHCHMLFHEDSGMMGQFVMLKPGQTAKIQTAYQPDAHHSEAPAGGGHHS